MLAQATRYRVFVLLKSIFENEKIVEEQRNNLAKLETFEPYAAFKRLDTLDIGKISAHDIINFLK